MDVERSSLEQLIDSLATNQPFEKLRDKYLDYLYQASGCDGLALLEHSSSGHHLLFGRGSLAHFKDEVSKQYPFDLSGHVSIFETGEGKNGIRIVVTQGKSEDQPLWHYLWGLVVKQQKDPIANQSTQEHWDLKTRSKLMELLLKEADLVALKDIPILISGESGTGKELLARRIHSHSPRSKGPFIPINCAALNDTLLETELFGYKAGSFTGAEHDTPGKLESADKGTLFLDEIGEMSPGFQSKLMRFLDSGDFTAVGSLVSQKADVRVIAATHKELPRIIRSGNFRNDLYYRISVCSLKIPSLRDRPEDIPYLADYFIKLKTGKGISEYIQPEAVVTMFSHLWPGNVRELQNLVTRVVLSQDRKPLDNFQLSNLLGIRNDSILHLKTYKEAVNLYKKRLIHTTLELYNGNRTLAARALGLQRTYLIKLIDEMNLENDS